MSKARHKSTGRTSGLGIIAYFITIFEANELLPRSKKMPDSVIARKVAREFPDRPSAQDFMSSNPSKTVNSYRYRYNKGSFTKGIPPRTFSFRYNEEGERVNGKTGTYLLSGKDVYEMLDKHQHYRTAVLEDMI